MPNAETRDRALKILAATLFLLVAVALGAFWFTFGALRGAHAALLDQKRLSDNQISALSEEVSQYKSALAALSSGITTRQDSELSPETAAAMLANGVAVRADCHDLGHQGPNGLENYAFRIKLDGPDDTLSRIGGVSYYFDHPTFSQKELRSRDVSSHFQEGYTGWGCLNSVIVRIQFARPAAQAPPINFNMCKALQRGCDESGRAVPRK